MSYCRIGSNSAVYVYLDCSGNIVCCSCRLMPGEGFFKSFRTDCSTEMLAHLKAHRKIGQKVPKHAMDRLQEEKAN